jgi:hypothetical protein
MSAVDKQSGFIYRISAQGSNRVYVGQTVDPERRYGQHKAEAAGGRHHNIILGRFLTKHPDAVFLYWPSDDVAADEVEYERNQREGGFTLMNLIPCGGRSPMLNRDVADKVRISMRGNKNALGVKRSDEVRARMSAAKKGRPWSAAARASWERKKLSIGVAA